jgi:hypothetical protein
MSPGDFNPHSIDAQLATVLQRMNAQDVYLRAIHTQTTLTNGRVNKLEQKWIYVAGLIFGGWFVIGVLWVLFIHFSR